VRIYTTDPVCREGCARIHDLAARYFSAGRHEDAGLEIKETVSLLRARLRELQGAG
jgi:hypothetical protein